METLKGKLIWIKINFEIIFVEKQAELKDQPGLWKEIRGKILNALEIKICQVLNKDCDSENNEFVEKIILNYTRDEKNSCVSQRSQSEPNLSSEACEQKECISNETTPMRTVFVIDDNNYLSSMRYQFYQG